MEWAVVGRCITLRLVRHARWVPGDAGGATRLAPRAGRPCSPRRSGGLGWVFLVPADECCGDQLGGRSVQQQTELAQEQSLTDNGRQYRHIHGVADIAIQPADD
jgi:hypothetical protein